MMENILDSLIVDEGDHVKVFSGSPVPKKGNSLARSGEYRK